MIIQKTCVLLFFITILALPPNANGEDLSKIDDDNINNMIENYETVEIQFFDQNEIDTIEVSSQKYDSLIFILDNFILNSINQVDA